MSRTLSLPHEHGGYLTIAGATAAGLLVAHTRAPSLAIGTVAAAAFFARAPVEELTRGRGARFDALATALFAIVIALAAAALEGPWRAIALVIATAVVAGSALARRARHQRAIWFETIGMAALGGSAGLIALAGGVAPRLALSVAFVLAAHTALAVPLVRTEVRPKERARAGDVARIALAVLGGAAVALAVVGEGRLVLALVPRTLHALARLRPSPSRARPNVVGVRESVMLAVMVATIVMVA